MTWLLPLPIVLPLVAAALSILTGRSRVAQRIIGVGTLATLVGVAIALLVEVDRTGILVTQAGNRAAPLGITLVASYLGLLFWELRYVSISLAHPGLKPTPKETSLR